jgi:drug/metabolite transporter (DMT)-like permease
VGACRAPPLESLLSLAATTHIGALPRALAGRPRAIAVAGALTIAFSSILVRLSHTSPSTSAIFRCLYALPLLALLAWREDRRLGARPARDRRLALVAGVFLGIDLLCWHRAIADIGAGLATVLANLQVAAVPLLAWAVLGERPGRRVLAALPVVLAGIVLISGALEQGAYGRDPRAGAVFGILTGLTYAGYILVLRHGSGARRPPAGPLFDVTLSAAATTLAGGLLVGDAHLVPTWPGHAWLVTLALTSQVLGWLLISVSLPRLPAAVASMLLTIQPIGSVVLAAIIFGEAPTVLQIGGVVALLAGLVAVAGSRRAEPAG